jgi:WD40 repeat protein/tRNA A-37 threonylcarbamoyl transferase component Bud32
MPKANDKIGPYTLISKLGRGAFGVVWLAEKRTAIATTKVAIKIPNDEDVDLEAVKQEASLWVHASGHPNVLPIIDADIHDEQVIIVSEYAPDGSLSKWLEKHGGKAPSVESAVEMTLGILAGLEHLHERGIIHRDLKPDNILLQRETPRLADFGIARILKNTSQSTAATGTPVYMPPEAFDGKRSVQTDIWSAGVIFYQLLRGRLPFPQTDMTSLLSAIITKEPEPLPELIPDSIRLVIERALKKSLDERYKSANEMRRALRNASQLPSPVYSSEAETINLLPAAITHAQAQSSQELNTSATSPIITPAPKPSFETQQPHMPPFRPVRKSNRALWLVVLLVGISITAGILFFVLKYKSGTSSGNQSNISATTQNLPTPERSVKIEGQMKTLTGHSKAVNSVAVSPDGQAIISGSADGTIKVWDARTGALVQTLEQSGNEVVSVAFSADGKLVAIGLSSSGGQGTALILDNSLGKLGEVRQKLPENNINTVAISPDGQTLAIGNVSGTLKLLDVVSGTLMQRLEGQDVQTRSVAFSPDGKSVVGGGYGNTVKIWDAETGALKRTLSGHSNEITAVAFSPDGKTVASGSFDNTVRLWDSETGALKQTLTGADFLVQTVAFSPDSKLVAGGANHNLLVWETQTGVLKQTVRDDSTSLNTIAYSPDGKLMVSGNADGTVKLLSMTR